MHNRLRTGKELKIGYLHQRDASSFGLRATFQNPGLAGHFNKAITTKTFLWTSTKSKLICEKGTKTIFF